MKRLRGRTLSLAWLPLVPLLTGCMMTKSLAFGTGTKVGLDISQRVDQTVEVSFGYDRAEIVSIPADAVNATTNGIDTYSVLGTFEVAYGNPWSEPLVVTQFFATGFAAQTAAQSPGFREAFGRKTGQIIQKGEAQKQEIRKQ